LPDLTISNINIDGKDGEMEHSIETLSLPTEVIHAPSTKMDTEKYSKRAA